MSKSKKPDPTPVMGKWKVISGKRETKDVVYGIAVAVQFHDGEDDMAGDVVTVTNRFGHTTKVTLGEAVKTYTEHVSGLGNVEFILYHVAETNA